MYGNSFWALTDQNDDILCFKNYGPKCPLSFPEDAWTCLSNMDTSGDPNWLMDQNVDLQCVSDAQTAKTLNSGCCQAIIIIEEEENRQQTLKSGRHDYYEKLLKHAFKHLDRQKGA